MVFVYYGYCASHCGYTMSRCKYNDPITKKK